MNDNLDRIIVVGDRVLVKPNDGIDRTKSGLYLPAGYQDKETVLSGYVLKCGPGYPLPTMDEGEAWNPTKRDARYLPLQVQQGDLALFLQKNAIEIKYDGERYFIVPQNAILLVEREDD
ncbi:MAG: co-chaperone GroES [Bacteroidales bacterium]|nr:co-chaperone GroES [Bacteroidales bacterium]